jgi:phage terminase large subunit
MPDIQLDLPEKLQFLFEPYRYKVAHGGRGSGKSWGFADGLLLYAAHGEPERILCTREVQKSIKESVHHLLSDQIQRLGLGMQFEVLDTVIRSRSGSEIIFAGLAGHTVESIKSYEGVDKVWVEEAQTVSKKSWDILTPTIRKPGSEIWVTFNPVLDTDETWKRFVINTPPNSHVVQINYADNPWFPDVLETERLHCLQTQSKEDYDNIWEGVCRSAVIGAIYAHEMAKLGIDQRVRPVPYDPRLKVHAIWDLGWNDKMAITLVQRGATDMRVIGYIEDSFKTLDYYVAEMRELRYNWGYDWLPHDGRTKDIKTGKSSEEILKRMGRKVRITPNIGVENGIKAARMLFPRCYFDTVKTERLRECLKRYRRAVNPEGTPGAPVHDEYSNGADSFRYLGVVCDMISNDEDDSKSEDIEPFTPLDPGVGY